MQPSKSTAASLIIRQSEMRQFWARSFRSEIVSWLEFWNALLLWFQPHVDTLVARVLQDDCPIRGQCQQHISLQMGSSKFVHVGIIDEAFPPDVPVVQQLEWLVISAVQQTETGNGARSKLHRTAHTREPAQCFLHDFHSLRRSYTSHPLDDHSWQTVVQRLSPLTSQLYKHIRLLTASSSEKESEHHGLHLDITADGRLSLEPLSNSHGVADLLPLETAGANNRQAIFALTHTLQNLKQTLQQIRSSLNGVCCRSGPCPSTSAQAPIVCVTGPALSGKTHLAKYLLHAAADTLVIGAQNQPRQGSVHMLDMSGIFNLEQAVGKLSASCSCSPLPRDMKLPLKRLHSCSDEWRSRTLCLDQVDALPSKHLADFVRLILHALPTASVIVIGKTMRLKPSQLVCHEALKSWSKVPLTWKFMHVPTFTLAESLAHADTEHSIPNTSSAWNAQRDMVSLRYFVADACFSRHPRNTAMSSLLCFQS